MPSSVTRMVEVAGPPGFSVTRNRPIAASQTISPKEFVIASDSNGRVTRAAAAGANIAAAGANVRLAVFNDSAVASPAADTLVNVLFLRQGAEIKMPLCSGDSAQTWSNAYLNKRYEIRCRTTTGEYVVDVSANTNAKVEILGVDPETAGDAAPYVICGILEDSWAK